MSKVICIPCLNLEYYDCEYVIHHWSRASCSVCEKTRQGLLVSILNCPRKRSLTQDEIKRKMEAKKRRLYDDDFPEGYLESDKDFVLNNCDLCVKILEDLTGEEDIEKGSIL